MADDLCEGQRSLYASSVGAAAHSYVNKSLLNLHVSLGGVSASNDIMWGFPTGCLQALLGS